MKQIYEGQAMTAHQDDHREPCSTPEEEDPIRKRGELLRGRAVSFCKAFMNGQSPLEILDGHFVGPDTDRPRITEHGPVWAGERLPFLGRTFVGRRRCRRRHLRGLAGSDDDGDDVVVDEQRRDGDDEDRIKFQHGHDKEEETSLRHHQSCDDYFDLLGRTLRPRPGTLAFPDPDQFIVDPLADVHHYQPQNHLQQQHQQQRKQHGNLDEKSSSISSSLSSPSNPLGKEGNRGQGGEAGGEGEGGGGGAGAGEGGQGGAGGERESDKRGNQGGNEKGREGGLVSVSGTGQWQSVRTGQGWKESFTFRLSQFDHEGLIGYWEIWADPLSAWLAVHGDLPSSSSSSSSS